MTGSYLRLPAAALILAACAGPLAAGPQTASPATSLQVIAGPASVIDGDTVEIGGRRIRLSGFDTPERGAACGDEDVYAAASRALEDFTRGKSVTCTITGADRFARLVATCDAGGDLGQHMVAGGWGRDWPRYSAGAYAGAEAEARVGGRGLWGLACPDSLWGGRTYD